MPDNASDRAADSVTAYMVDVLRLAAGHLKKALTSLRSLAGTLTGFIRDSFATLNRAARLANLLREAKLAINDAFRMILRDHRAELRDFARVGIESTRALLAAALGADIFRPKISTAELAGIVDDKILFGQSLADWWNRQSLDLKMKFAAVVQQGVMNGWDREAIIDRIVGTAGAAYRDGVMAAQYTAAAAITRTAAVHVANEARTATLTDMAGLVSSIQWVARLDSKTCVMCAALDGLQWTLPDHEPIDHEQDWPGASAHPNCRCSQIPVLRPWGDLAGHRMPTLDGAAIERRLRDALTASGTAPGDIDAAIAEFKARLDGEPARVQTFDEWMSAQPAEVIDNILGPGRRALWEAGATLEQMIDQTGRILTLEQLRARIKKAGG